MALTREAIDELIISTIDTTKRRRTTGENHRSLLNEIMDYVDANSGGGTLKLIASKEGVNGNSLATTVLDLASGITRANVVPSFAVYRRASGNITALQAKVEDSNGEIANNNQINVGTSSSLIRKIVIDNSYLSTTGDYSVIVTNANGSACTFDVELYGFTG